MPNLGPAELMLVLAVALIVFGPKKLPEMGKSFGKAMREFNKARNDFMDSLHTDTDHEPSRTAYPSVADTSVPETSVPAPTQRSLEYPEPLDTASADALPYGGDFYAADGDSQPAFRTNTIEPEAAPVTSAAHAVAHAGEGKA